ncbi:MAG: hypothetical protein VKK59_07110, partial [Vampirovibrionales bacterium]|nr:hypothetical protein [Vampirovibrionales bacterium]
MTIRFQPSFGSRMPNPTSSSSTESSPALADKNHTPPPTQTPSLTIAPTPTVDEKVRNAILPGLKRFGLKPEEFERLPALSPSTIMALQMSQVLSGIKTSD